MDLKTRFESIRSDSHENDTMTDYETFLNENRRRINRRFNIMLRMIILVGPMIAIGVRLGIFADVTYGTALFVSCFMLTTTIVHALLMKKYADSSLTGLIALISIDVLLCVMNRAHLSIYITWFIIPLLSLQFCDYIIYVISVVINCGFMVLSTWDMSSWFAERRTDVDTAKSYFASRIGGFSIEMTMMIVAGFVLCRMVSGYYKTMIEKVRELNDNHETLTRLNGELSSMANIYYSAHDINIHDDTFFEIFLNFDTVSQIIGDQKTNARKLLVKIMDRLTSPRSKAAVMRFIDFDTLNKRLKNTETVTLEFEGITGKWSKCRFIVSERDENGDLLRVIWLVESIDAEKKQRDALIDMSQKAIAASEAKSSFLSNMSHEIRTPINAVLGMNEMIIRESDNPDILTYAHNIKNAGGTLLGLVNDILDFSKIEAGKMEIMPVDYDLSSVVNDLVNMIHSRAESKGLILALDFDKDIPKLLNGDEVRIKQVITNILTNAVKYTEKGSIVFGMGFERIEDEPDSVMLNVFVKDTGIGIKKEDMDKLFSEFERIEEDRNRNIEGTGLGMNITQSLLEMMGTTLRVESAYGLGSRFYFSLKQKVVKWEPIGDYETTYKESLKGRSVYHEKFIAPNANVLVVDDNNMNLMVFVNLLKQTKVVIDTASSGDEGLSYTDNKKYDLIFLDHMMPGKDGIRTLHELREKENNPNINTPVICLTANAISGVREEYIEAGFNDYLAKPIDPQRLEDMMLQYLPTEKLEKVYLDTSEEETADSLPEFMYDIAEIDTGIGVTNNGSISAYLETLKVFAKNAAKYTDEIKTFMGLNDLKNATIKVHALKSTARIIGAADIGELAQRLENACKAEDLELLKKELPGLLERADRLGDDLAPLIENEPDTEGNESEISDIELKNAYSKIKELAGDCDNAGIEDIMNMLENRVLPDIERDRVEAIRASLENFDFDSIIALL